MFVKTHRQPPAGFFTTEATGLAWLGEAFAVDVPRVLAVSDDSPAFLALEWIERGVAGPSTETRLRPATRRLAPRRRCRAFGREDRRTTGSRALPNEPTDTWAEFYAPTDCYHSPNWHPRPAPSDDDDRDARNPSPDGSMRSVGHRSRRRGCTATYGVATGSSGLGGRSWLIDPAAHGGHREFDLAMMRLFGGFGDDCFAAYNEVFPLSAGWHERVALHQIAPLVVHAIKFGGGYVPAATKAIDRYS